MESHEPASDPATVADTASAAEASAVPERLERRVVFYWWMTDVARAATMALGLVFGMRHLRAELQLPEWSEDVAMGFGAFLLASALVAPPWLYATWRFAVDSRLLSMRHGMLFVEDRRIPVPRMQHVDIVRGPVERLFGLATLVVFTAGNEGSAFRVPGLSKARAEAMRDGILRARGRDVV